jgi:hypothetical protein
MISILQRIRENKDKLRMKMEKNFRNNKNICNRMFEIINVSKSIVPLAGWFASESAVVEPGTWG